MNSFTVLLGLLVLGVASASWLPGHHGCGCGISRDVSISNSLSVEDGIHGIGLGGLGVHGLGHGLGGLGVNGLGLGLGGLGHHGLGLGGLGVNGLGLGLGGVGLGGDVSISNSISVEHGIRGIRGCGCGRRLIGGCGCGINHHGLGLL